MKTNYITLAMIISITIVSLFAIYIAYKSERYGSKNTLELTNQEYEMIMSKRTSDAFYDDINGTYSNKNGR